MYNNFIEFAKKIWADPVWSKVISAIILTVGGTLIARFYKRDKVKKTETKDITLIDLRKFNDDDIEIETPKSWDNKTNAEFGKRGEGNYNVKGGVLEIERYNTEGRYLIRFVSYDIDGKRVPYIQNSDRSKPQIRLYITFEAKVTNGAHLFRVMCKKYHDAEWVPNSHLDFRITSPEYQKHRREIKVPLGFDFRIQIDDIDNENSNSKIHIKDFKVVKLG